MTNDDADEFRLVRCPVPRDADQDHDAWQPVRPEDPTERLERSTRSPATPCCGFRSGGRHRLRVLPLDDLGSDGVVVDPALRRRHGRAGAATRSFDRDVGHRRATSPTSHPPVWSRRRPRHRRAHRAAPAGRRPATTRRRYVCETRTFPSADGTPVPVTLVRHRDTPLDGTAPALLYGYGAYEAIDEPGVGPGTAEPARPRAWSSRTPTSAAAARAAGAGGSTAASSTSRTPSPTTSPSPTGWPALVDGTRLATRGLSAGGLLQGAVFSQRPGPVARGRRRGAVRRRGHHDVRRDDPADRQRVGRVGRPAAPGGVRLDARLLAVRQPAAGGLAARPAGHRRAARPAGDGLRAGQVGGRPARVRPRVVAALPVPRARPAPAPTPAPPAASPTSPTRPRSTPGCCDSATGDRY